MALFNRNNKTNVPAEIQEYYETGKRDRTGIAWLLAFGTLILTIVLAAGIFFAGRWAYRKIAGSDNKASQVAQNDTPSQEEQKPETPGSSTDEQSVQEKEKQQAEEDKQQAEQEQQKQEEADRKAEEQQKAEAEKQKAAAESEAQKNAQTESSNATSTQSETGSDIPNTGPGDTLAMFFGVSVLGYLLHRVYSARATKP